MNTVRKSARAFNRRKLQQTIEQKLFIKGICNTVGERLLSTTSLLQIVMIIKTLNSPEMFCTGTSVTT